MDFSDLSKPVRGSRPEAVPGRRARADRPACPGSDYEAAVRLSLEQASHGAEIDLELSVLERAAEGGSGGCPIG